MEHAEESYPEEIRFNMDADDYDSVIKYLRNRATQLMGGSPDLQWNKIQVHKLEDWGVHAVFVGKDGNDYHCVYIFNSHRGKSHFPKWVAQNPGKVIFTMDDCQVEEYLKRKGVLYVVGKKPIFPEYNWIEEYYGNKKARRSGVHLINHIDEGLYILGLIGASELAKRAYAAHPLLQSDVDLAKFWQTDKYFESMDRRVLLLATEYRNIANAYLSPMPSRKEIALSPIKEVNDMLIADKIQNRKDFELYHKGTHPKSDRLTEYFAQWLHVLGISEEKYQEVKKDILQRTGISHAQ